MPDVFKRWPFSLILSFNLAVLSQKQYRSRETNFSFFCHLLMCDQEMSVVTWQQAAAFHLSVNSYVVYKHLPIFTFSSFHIQAYFQQKCTPSVPNYKISQEFWRVKAILSLTKIIERNIKKL